MWDLFANPRDPRADSPSTVDEEASQQSNPPSLSRRDSFSSVTSEGSALASLEAGGSWPRIRKQRTSETHSMSLFDVAEALEQQHLESKQPSPSTFKHVAPPNIALIGSDDQAMDAEISNLAALVAEQEAAASDSASSNVSVESFVEAVFRGIVPPASSSAPPVASSGAALPTHHQHQHQQPPHRAPSQPRAPTANELALLEAIAADEAAAAAEAAAQAAAAHAQAAKAKAKAAAANAYAHQQAARSSGTSPVPPALGGPAEELYLSNMTSDDLCAMLQMDLPSPSAVDGAPPHVGWPTRAHGMDAHLPHRAPPPPTPHFAQPPQPPEQHHQPAPPHASPLLAPQHAPPHAPPPPLNSYSSMDDHDELHHSPPQLQPWAPRPAYGAAFDRARHDDEGGHGEHGLSYEPPLDTSDGFDGLHDLHDLRGLEDLSANGLARRLEHAMNVPLDGFEGADGALDFARQLEQGLPPAAPLQLSRAVLAPPATSASASSASSASASASAASGRPAHGFGFSRAAPRPAVATGTVLPPAGTLALSQLPAPPPAFGGAAPAPVPMPAPAAAPKPARNGAERKEWSESEDAIIRASVVEHGCKWRKIAAQLPGRSDDAVRNRWNRLKEMDNPSPRIDEEPMAVGGGAVAASSLEHAAGLAAGFVSIAAGAAAFVQGAPPPAPSQLRRTSAEGGGAKGEREKPERISWTKAEDDTILRSVAELGHKWNRIAERLPGRTDHAIRNRFHRLQSLLQDRQRQQQRVLAPAQPLHFAPSLGAAALPLGAKQAPDTLEDGPSSDGASSNGASNCGFDGGFDTPSGGGALVTPPGSR